ncbi:MAG: cytochrome c nitrite reductase small subunit [Spirochaetaceae bacterium]|nr:cytochrome c nitrite reductase small subunit [Spirochaetaceae bacterium]|tara:strand:- start:563 stop:1075 length:513 start_codon:yes stop_codon:yes gene_type:complete
MIKKFLNKPWTKVDTRPVPAASKAMLIVGFLGLLFGMGIYTFVYAKGHSYLTDNSQACVNCHVMKPQFDAWMKSSHGPVASCNSCHTPPGALAKYMTKAQNGVAHAWAFSTGLYPENIRITERNKQVTVQACIGCHGNVFSHPAPMKDAAEEGSCIKCHSNVGHPEGRLQ